MKRLSPLFFLLLAFQLTAQNTIVITDADLIGDTDYIWTADNEYLLDGHVFLEAGGTLTIEPGTVIRGKGPENITTDFESSLLAITRSAQIFAEGTEAAPIIFTSETDDINDPYDLSFTDPGTWSGVVIMGNAPVTTTENLGGITRCFFSTEENDTKTLIGGGVNANPDESSGVFKYISIRHAGQVRSSGQGSYLNGAFLAGGVGRGTELHHVEVIFNSARGMFFQGGTVDHHHMVSALNASTGIHYWGGYSGKGQFILSHRNRGAAIQVQGPDLQELPIFTAPNLVNVSCFGFSEGDLYGFGAVTFFGSSTAGSLRNALAVNALSGLLVDSDTNFTHIPSLVQMVNGEIVFSGNHFNDRSGEITTFAEVVNITNANAEVQPVPTAAEILAFGAATSSVSNNQVAGVNEDDPLYFNPVPVPGSSVLTGGEELTEDGFVPVSYQGAFGPDDNWLTWTFLGSGDGQGQFFTGRVNLASVGCVSDPNDPTAPGIIVRAQGADFSRFTTTDEDGNYRLFVPSGEYTLSAVAPGQAWESCIEAQVTVVTGEERVINLQLAGVRNCADMSVDITSPFLRRGFENTYYLRYENVGSTLARNPVLSIVLSPDVTFVSSTLPVTQQVGDTLFYSLDDIAPFAPAGNIKLTVFASQEIPLDAERCALASITTDDQCLPESGPHYNVSGKCIDGLVNFRITNIGDATPADAVHYIVIEDEVLLQEGETQLAPGDFIELNFPDNGSVYHLSTEAFPDEPFPGIAAGTATCSDNPETFFNQYPVTDDNRAADFDCQKVTGSYDPNDKRGLPAGLTAENIIPRNLTMDYRIRFQNTGTDTAFRVVVVDTLSPLLDPASIRMGASSHSYTWTLEGERILKVTYTDIMLPDSNVNEPASNGFFDFKIRMVPNIPYGTELDNFVDIYFDLNEPVRTNTTQHLIDLFPGQDPVAINEFAVTNDLLSIFPQPANEEINIALKSGESLFGTYILYDASGRAISGGTAVGEVLTLAVDRFESGMYFFVLRDTNGQLSASHRLLIAR